MLIRMAVLAGLFGFLFGADTGILAGALPFVRTHFALSEVAEGAIIAAVPFAAVIGVLFAMVSADRVGRKPVLVASACLFSVGALASALAGSTGTLIFSRLLIGAAVGASVFTTPIYLAEIAPAKARGAIVCIFQLMITIGILAAFIAGYGLAADGDWRMMFGLGLIPAVICLAGIVFSPETPRWLVLKNRVDEAHAVLQQTAPDTPQRAISQIIQNISDEHANQKNADSWRHFLTRENLYLTAFCVTGMALAQLSGINVILTYAPKFFEYAGFQGTSSQLLATIGIGATNVLMTFVSIYLVDRLGRRPLLIAGFAGTAASLGVISAAYAIAPASMGYLILAGLLAYIIFFAICLGPITFVYASELFPLALRAKGMALVSLGLWLSNFLLLFAFPPIEAFIGQTGTFALFTAVCVFGFLFAVKYAPEPKGIELEDIDARIAEQRPELAGDCETRPSLNPAE
ncbi:sugar porter family MFS transporter [Roseibium sp. RKSG952]|uniref:sugar porter family MFS transporter n=1 Tax=Roseibium sp. RKSG952 TaxID=2529384 RepID=UPI0018AD0ECA|nr:sugar porter family MFS transporter [Roseibium sp. RKSG952]